MNTISVPSQSKSTKGFTLDAVVRIPGKMAGEPYQSLICQFLTSIYQAGYSIKTVTSFGYNLNQWAIGMQQQGCNHLNQIKRQTLREWGAMLREKYMPQTQKQAIMSVKNFYRWLEAEELCESNPAKVLHAPTIKIRRQRTLTLDEIDKLLKTSVGYPTGIRDAAIIALLVDTGLRAGELCNLKMTDLSLEYRRVDVVGKGGNSEQGYFSEDCIPYLNAWLQSRKETAKSSNRLFFSLGGIVPGSPLTSRGLRIILKKVGQRAGVKNVHPHAFRRSFATLRIKAGQSTRSVQVLGRWKDLKMFERYTMALLDDSDFARESASEHSPLSKLSE